MHPDLYVVVQQQRDRELARELELRLAAQECPGCVVRARRRLVGLAQRVRARFAGMTATAAPACCPA
ncbi:hypothetical protein [Cellulomonas persica]|uniref:Uncharacterized protein n=1 Tax=Cellulomonas persica TaxID=76861 RepID=A0A510UX39_9CELL|nr:hypothetical protein [Cellulomonas persica]GEK17355.1 hypothetical protein CPE01_10880 [Cellulomonas persica]